MRALTMSALPEKRFTLGEYGGAAALTIGDNA